MMIRESSPWLVLDFDLFYYAFGQLGTVVWAWMLMFSYTLLGPYHVLSVWASLNHGRGWRTCVSTVAALTLCAAQMSMLGIFPVYVVLHYQLPPASRFIIILEQILASLFYLYFILVRLCIPVFRNKSNQPFSTRTFILALFHATFPDEFLGAGDAAIMDMLPVTSANTSSSSSAVTHYEIYYITYERTS